MEAIGQNVVVSSTAPIKNAFSFRGQKMQPSLLFPPVISSNSGALCKVFIIPSSILSLCTLQVSKQTTALQCPQQLQHWAFFYPNIHYVLTDEGVRVYETIMQPEQSSELQRAHKSPLCHLTWADWEKSLQIFLVAVHLSRSVEDASGTRRKATNLSFLDTMWKSPCVWSNDFCNVIMTAEETRHFLVCDFTDQSDGCAVLQGWNGRPLPCAFLSGAVADLGQQVCVISVPVLEDVRRDLNQEGVQLCLVPVVKSLNTIKEHKQTTTTTSLSNCSPVPSHRGSFPGRPSSGDTPHKSAACRRTQCRCGPFSQNVQRPRLRPAAPRPIIVRREDDKHAKPQTNEVSLTQSQQGSPVPTLAAMLWKMSLMCGLKKQTTLAVYNSSYGSSAVPDRSGFHISSL